MKRETGNDGDEIRVLDLDAPEVREPEVPMYRKWVGVVLSFILSGAAQFLAGNKRTGVLWYVSIVACQLGALCLAAIPVGFLFYVAVLIFCATFVLWIIMLKQSYRPVRKIGLWGWILVVLVEIALDYTVAAGTRTIVHPFKIPTGAMQPTLYGIRVVDQVGPLPKDHHPPGLLQWLRHGTQYREVIAESSGALSRPSISESDPRTHVYVIGRKQHEIPIRAKLSVQVGAYVRKGDLLWAGTSAAGDHVLVERVSTLFRRPRRGEVIVFKTDDIDSLPQGTHYIKRVVGLPGETVSIDPPNILINGDVLQDPPIFSKISGGSAGYAGYRLAGTFMNPTDSIALGEDEVFVLGDNTKSSKDSRYWGAVPRKNIVGRATRVYWPLSRIKLVE